MTTTNEMPVQTGAVMDVAVRRVDFGYFVRPGPRRRRLSEALADVGHRVADIELVVNCHLHFDHCGGAP